MKRALLTLLTDLSPAALRAVAEVWAVALMRRTHADNVALVFGAMTDRWVFDDLFDTLPEPARMLLATLVTQFAEGLPRDAIAAVRGEDPAAFAEALAPLTAAMLVVRGPDGSLSVPRELATLVTRAVHERQGEDEASPSLGRLLAVLDLDVLADAARHWGVPDVLGSVRPGERERLITELRRRAGSARALAEVEESLSLGAKRVVAALRDYADALPLDEAVALAGIETLAERRTLLRELTTSLLARQVWIDGTRVLVMPTTFRVPGTAALPPLVAVAAVTTTPRWRHPYALAWDMLTLLRLIEREVIAAATGGLAALAENYALAEALAPQFWVGRDSPNPPAAALAFLATLAEARGLVVTEDARHLTLHDPVAWAKEEFPAQTRALFATWRALAAWPEGRGTSVALWGVHWPTFRTRLLEALGACGTDQWHTLENVLARLVAVRPALLGEGFTAAGAVGQTHPDRDLLTRLCAEATLRTALTWFGVITWGKAKGGQPALQLTDVGRWLLDRGPEPSLDSEPGPPLTVDTTGHIAVRRGEPHHLWPLMAFAEAQTLDRIAVYRMTVGTLRRALRRGLSVAQITRFLTQRVGGALPEEVQAMLTEVAHTLRRVTLVPALLLATDDPAIRPEITRLLREAGAEVEAMPDGRLLIQHSGGEEAIIPALTAADFFFADREQEPARVRSGVDREAPITHGPIIGTAEDPIAR